MRGLKRGVVVMSAVAMFAVAARTVSADPQWPQDDKNNPTAPGQMQGPAWDNRNEHCSEHYAGEKGGGSISLRGQCQGPGPNPLVVP